MTTRKIQKWRRLAALLQAVVIVGLPFLRINDESALRFDVSSLKLHFFGRSLWMEEFFVVLVVLIFFSLLIVFITLMLGRVWCGWACPQSVIADFTRFVDRAVGRGIFSKTVTFVLAFLASVLISANLIWYFVSPYDFASGLSAGNLGNVVWIFWIVLTLILFLDFVFLRYKFCATVCPYAKLQSTLFDSSSLLVAFDPRRKEECIDCLACVRTCPVGIDIRDGLNAACIHCAECVDRCSSVMAARKKPSLVNYFWGLPGQEGKIVRQNAFVIGTVTLLFGFYLVYLISARPSLDIAVLPNYSYQPRYTEQGRIVNAYILSIKNKSGKDETVKIKAVGLKEDIKIVPGRLIDVKAGQMVKKPVYISVNESGLDGTKHSFLIIVESVGGESAAASMKTHFVVPEKR